MGKIHRNAHQIEEWIAAAEEIRRQFGVEKALGYVIGEKFYLLVRTLRESRRVLQNIENERRKPGYNPIRETTYGIYRQTEDLEEIFERERETAAEADALLKKFVILILGAFEHYEVRTYFQSNPRLGTMGAIASDEQFDLMVSRGAVEHTLDTEIEDALIFGEMLRYFGLTEPGAGAPDFSE